LLLLQVREVLDTFRVAARLGTSSLAAYVISMSQAASDVLAVELLQKEARMMVRGQGWQCSTRCIGYCY
jgi:phosphoenolpyruvate carboxylase